MKQTKYSVFFTDGTCVEERGMSPFQAYVKACAKRINDAKPCLVKFIDDEDHGGRYLVETVIKMQIL
jgi:hypothetical protein